MPTYQRLMRGALEKLAKRQAEMDALQAEAARQAELAAKAKATFADPSVAPKGPLTLYHGSPHKFEEFDFENNMLRGEGAMAFGPGGYMTGNVPLAKSYARTLYEKHSNRNKTAHKGIVEAAKMDPVATAEFLRAKTVANLRPQLGALNMSAWDLVVPPPHSPFRAQALQGAEAAWPGGPVYPKALPAMVTRSSPDLERYADIVGDRGTQLMRARIGKGGVSPKDAVELGRELRSLLSKYPEVRPRVQERLVFDKDDPMLRDKSGVWVGSMAAREEIGRRNAPLGAGAWGPPIVSGFNPRRANLNSTARVIEGRPGNTNYFASMSPHGSGRVDLRNPPEFLQGQFARRLYSAPFEAGFDEMLPWDWPLEHTTPKTLGALSQLAAAHGIGDAFDPAKMTGEQFIRALKGAARKKASGRQADLELLQALKDAGVPATFFLRGGRRDQLPTRVDPNDFNFVIHDQSRLGKPDYEEFRRGGPVA